MPQPHHKFSLGLLSVALFDNGERLPNVSLSRRYRDKSSDEWKSSSVSLGPSEISAAISLLKRMEESLLAESAEPLSA